MTRSIRLALSACLHVFLVLTLFAVPSLAEVSVEFIPVDEPLRSSAQTVPKQLGNDSALVLPYFKVEPANPLGETTLYAVRNNSTNPVTVLVSYYSHRTGNLFAVDEYVLQPHAVRTVNMRAVQDLPVDGSGYASGYVLVEALGSGLPDAVISGDYFRVDIAKAAASGGALMSAEATGCRRWTHRFFSGGDFNGSTRLAFTVLNPGAGGPAVAGNVYDEAGNLVAAVAVTSDQRAFELTDLDLQLPVEFGSIDWVFGDESHGTVATTLAAEPLFSVGAEAACIQEIEGEPAPDGTVVFELPGNFLTCRGCGNWQYDMPLPERRNFSKVVVDFDLFVAGWDASRPGGFHCIFWLNNGPHWQQMMGYMNSRGTGNRNVFQVNGPLGNPIGVEKYASPGVQVGQNYSVHYEYDTVEKVVWYQVRNAAGDVHVSDFINLPASSGPVSTNYTFIQFGSQPGGAVESLTENWSWSNFRAQFIP